MIAILPVQNCGANPFLKGGGVCEGGFFNMAGKGICIIPDARFARYSVAALLTPAPQTKGLPKRFYEVKDFWEEGKADG